MGGLQPATAEHDEVKCMVRRGDLKEAKFPPQGEPASLTTRKEELENLTFDSSLSALSPSASFSPCSHPPRPL